jgi:hypothetical protein
MMKRLCGAIFGAAFLIATSTAAQVTAPNDHLIVPGERVGPFALGMTEAALQKVGKPSARSSYSGRMTPAGQSWDSVRYCYYEETVCADVASKTGTVVDIWLGSDGNCHGYHTADNMGCGMTLNDATRSLLWGEPISSYVNTFDENNRGKIMIAYFRNARAFTKLELVPQFWSEASPISDTVQWIDIVDQNYDHYHKSGD